MANTCTSMWRSPSENVAYEFVLTSPAASHMFCPSYLVDFDMWGRWLYSCCFVGCCFQNLFNIACSIFVQFPSNFFSICLFSVHVVHPYSCRDITTAWKKLHFILSDKFDFHMIDNLSIAVCAFTRYILMSFSVDEMLLPR